MHASTEGRILSVEGLSSDEERRQAAMLAEMVTVHEVEYIPHVHGNVTGFRVPIAPDALNSPILEFVAEKLNSLGNGATTA